MRCVFFGLQQQGDSVSRSGVSDQLAVSCATRALKVPQYGGRETN